MKASKEDINFFIEKYLFNKEAIGDIQNNAYVTGLWPLIYIISNHNCKEAYIGETTNAIMRMQNHLCNEERRKLDTLHLITCEKFNKSATLDIESNLIKYIAADGIYKLQNSNAGMLYHNYFEKDSYQDLFKNIWLALKKEGITKEDINKINNSDLFKYSPYKSLSFDQYTTLLAIIENLIKNDSNSIFVEGVAGTGKTILAIFLIKLLTDNLFKFEIDDYNKDNSKEIELINEIRKKFSKPAIALVIPMSSLRKTIQKVFKNIKGLKPNMVIGPSDVLKKKYDILIVDESHRLRRRRNLTNYKSFDDSNKKLGIHPYGNQLDWIDKQSNNQVFFYDTQQSVMPADISKEDFEDFKKIKNSPVIPLISQHRIKGGIDYVDFIDKLFNCMLSEDVNPYENEKYDFKFFNSISDLCYAIKKKEEEHGLCRIVAGYAWEWKSKNNKGTTDIIIEGQEFVWNSTTNGWINSDNAINEIGCLHTSQGYDLNYAGIIFGNEISFDPIKKEIIILKENYYDSKGKDGVADPEELKTNIINTYKTMMYRGILGTYVYVCDPLLKSYLEKYIPLAK